MPAGPIGPKWAAGSWEISTWEAGAWGGIAPVVINVVGGYRPTFDVVGRYQTFDIVGRYQPVLDVTGRL